MNIFDIPIITYHKISNQKEFGLTTVSPEIFKKQMQLLVEKGYHTITFNQIADKIELPKKPIIISFDDTYKSIYEYAFPVMMEFGLKGVLFVISDYIGKKNDWEAYRIQRKHLHATQEEIHEMYKSGFEIGSHGKSHKFLPYLSRDVAEKELKESKQFLEKQFSTKIITCCYPFGGLNYHVLTSAKNTGYLYGVANLRLNSKNKTNPLSFQRRSIYSNDSLKTFKQKISSSTKNLVYISEWLIQKGAYAGIIKSNIFNV